MTDSSNPNNGNNSQPNPNEEQQQNTQQQTEQGHTSGQFSTAPATMQSMGGAADNMPPAYQQGNERLNQALQPVNMYLGEEKVFASAHDAGAALVQAKSRIISLGYKLENEAIQGDRIVCTFTGPEGNLTTSQDLKTFAVSVNKA